VEGEKGPETSAVGEEMSRAESHGPRATGREPGAGSQKAEARSWKFSLSSGNEQQTTNRHPGYESPSNSSNNISNPLNIPSCGQVKNPSIGLWQSIEKTPRLFLTRFFADFFIE
jgi:hypothetical protein